MQSNPPPSNRRLPPLDFNGAFPLIQKSVYMRNFVESIIESARAFFESGNRRVFPLILGSNWLELPSFLLTIAEALKIPADSIHGDMSRSPLNSDAMADRDKRLIVIGDGDRMSNGLQMAYVTEQLAHIKMFIAIVRTEPIELDTAKNWDHAFYKRCTRTHLWPSWNQRKEDHEDLLIEMSQRLRLDLSIDAVVAELLKPGASVSGTDDAYALLKRRAGALGRQQPQERDLLVTKPDTLFPPTP